MILVPIILSAQTQRWVYRYNGPGNSIDEGLSLVFGSDGNIYTAGYSVGTGSSYDFTVISLTVNGNQRWVYRYYGPIYGGANSVIYGADGNIYIAGYSNGNGPNRDLMVISLTPTGAQRWVYRYNSPANSYNEAYSLVYGADSNIYVAGTSTGSGTDGDFTVVSLSSTGHGRWVYRYNGPANDYDAAFSIAYGADGNVYAAGSSMDVGIFNTDITVISLNPASGIEEREIASLPLAMTSGIELYPNPAKSFFIIRIPSSIKSQMLKMYDVSGKLVKDVDLPSAHSDKVAEMRVSLEEIKNGIYFLQLNNEPETKKLVITK